MERQWNMLCTPTSGCCPEYSIAADGSVTLRDNGAVVVLTAEQRAKFVAAMQALVAEADFDAHG
jgi:hypothetical protein